MNKKLLSVVTPSSIYHFDFVALLQCLHVPEYKSCRIYSFSREYNFLLNSDNCATKIFYHASAQIGRAEA